MAQKFQGSNNIPIFYRDGQFGTRLVGGKDAANARYVFTKEGQLFRNLFNPKDDPVLDYKTDDGDVVEPEHYVPVLPLILINGCAAGIGTGWACQIPCYNPIDIIKLIKMKLNDEDISGQELVPWYRGWKGEIKKINDKTFVTTGIIEPVKNLVKNVTELPVGMWTDKAKELIESFIEKKSIKSMKNYCTPTAVDFEITESRNGISVTAENIGLTTRLNTNNLVLFDENGRIRRYESPVEILESFIVIRLGLYRKRLDYQIANLEREYKIASTKLHFIESVISGVLDLMNAAEETAIDYMTSKKFYKIDDSYDYLLRLPIRSLTKQRVENLEADLKKIDKELKRIKNLTPKNMWLEDIGEFESEYASFLKNMDKEEARTAARKKRKSTKPKTTKKATKKTTKKKA